MERGDCVSLLCQFPTTRQKMKAASQANLETSKQPTLYHIRQLCEQSRTAIMHDITMIFFYFHGIQYSSFQ